MKTLILIFGLLVISAAFSFPVEDAQEDEEGDFYDQCKGIVNPDELIKCKVNLIWSSLPKEDIVEDDEEDLEPEQEEKKEDECSGIVDRNEFIECLIGKVFDHPEQKLEGEDDQPKIDFRF
ncbi:hypothetical protein ACFFRR_004568 [Megaselia abdita]